MWRHTYSDPRAFRTLNSTRPRRRRERRLRIDLQLERLEDRQLLSGPSVSFIKQNPTTAGNWINTYGSQGYDVIGNATSLPSYATLRATGQVEQHVGRQHDRYAGAANGGRFRTDCSILVLGDELHGQPESDR